MIETLRWLPMTDATPDLLGGPVATFLANWADAADGIQVAEIDPALSDTAQFCERYGVPLAESANCVVVTGRREGEARFAACVVPATLRADVNGVVRKLIDVRKASFVPMDDAVASTGMEYGGITPIGLPEIWPVYLAPEVVEGGDVIIGSGLRRSKLRLPGSLLAKLPSAQVVPGLAR
jgi:prolyl-tRNA editing enzyme YbaK/EbsC (Cys-tRNA(Pro) deacylase)